MTQHIEPANVRGSHIEVRGPDDQAWNHVVDDARLIDGSTLMIGRASQWSDVELDIAIDSPGEYVSKRHCDLVCREGAWWVVDHSANGTWVQTENGLQKVTGDGAHLTRGCIIVIAAGPGAGRGSRRWEIEPHLPDPTSLLPKLALAFEDDGIFVLEGPEKRPVELSDTPLEMLRFLFEWNRGHDRPTVCPYDELKRSGFAYPPDYVNKIRDKIEPEAGPKWRFLHTIRSRGYLLVQYPGEVDVDEMQD